MSIARLNYTFNMPMPMVFDDSFTYMEQVARVSEKCNEIINALEEMDSKANDYTDSQISVLNTKVNDINASLTKFVNDTISATVATVNASINSNNASVNASILANKTYVDTTVINLQTNVNTRISILETDFQNFKNAEYLKFEAFKVLISNKILDVLALAEAMNNSTLDYVKAEVQKIMDIINAIDYKVYNPIRGKMTDTGEAIADLYGYLRVDGITALEYDNLKLTATEYSDRHTSALNYDLRFRRYFDVDNYFHMLSPFTGKLTHIKEVIQQIVGYSQDSITAMDYDSKLLTATTYDEKLMIAYDYDWQNTLVI